MSNKLVKPQSNDVFIDNGEKVYTIKSKRGGKALGTFTFQPADTNIVNRYEEVVNFYNTYKMPDNPTDEDMRKIETEIKEKIAYLIGEDASDTFFSILGPFSPLESGELFIEQVLTVVAKVIEREMQVRTKKVQRRVNKYVAKYHN